MTPIPNKFMEARPQANPVVIRDKAIATVLVFEKLTRDEKAAFLARLFIKHEDEISAAEERGRKAVLEDSIKAVEDLRIVAILDQHDVSDEDAQYAGEIHNQSIDKVLSTLRSLSKPEVGKP